MYPEVMVVCNCLCTFMGKIDRYASIVWKKKKKKKKKKTEHVFFFKKTLYAKRNVKKQQ